MRRVINRADIRLFDTATKGFESRLKRCLSQRLRTVFEWLGYPGTGDQLLQRRNSCRSWPAIKAAGRRALAFSCYRREQLAGMQIAAAENDACLWQVRQ